MNWIGFAEKNDQPVIVNVDRSSLSYKSKLVFI
jgi:hypothetical protein